MKKLFVEFIYIEKHKLQQRDFKELCSRNLVYINMHTHKKIKKSFNVLYLKQSCAYGRGLRKMKGRTEPNGMKFCIN